MRGFFFESMKNRKCLLPAEKKMAMMLFVFTLGLGQALLVTQSLGGPHWTVANANGSIAIPANVPGNPAHSLFEILTPSKYSRGYSSRFTCCRDHWRALCRTQCRSASVGERGAMVGAAHGFRACTGLAGCGVLRAGGRGD